MGLVFADGRGEGALRRKELPLRRLGTCHPLQPLERICNTIISVIDTLDRKT